MASVQNVSIAVSATISKVPYRFVTTRLSRWIHRLRDRRMRRGVAIIHAPSMMVSRSRVVGRTTWFRRLADDNQRDAAFGRISLPYHPLTQ
jgi:hypothetical protein